MKITIRSALSIFWVCCISLSILTLSGCSDDKEKAQPAQQAVEEITAGVETLEDKIEAEVTELKETEQSAAIEAPVNEEVPEIPSDNTTTSSTPPQTHTVRAVVTKFQPMILFVNPGDTVTWTNMAGHDTAAVEGMVPEGTELWHSKMGDQFSFTFSETGAYVYKCTPHVSLGMLGAIIVGDGEPTNLEQITNHPDNKGMVGRAVRKMKKALGER